MHWTEVDQNHVAQTSGKTPCKKGIEGVHVLTGEGNCRIVFVVFFVDPVERAGVQQPVDHVERSLVNRQHEGQLPQHGGKGRLPLGPSVELEFGLVAAEVAQPCHKDHIKEG